jgi:anti-sigma B factor antagonist
MADSNEFVLDVEVNAAEDHSTVHLAGELDVFTVAQLRDAVHQACDDPPPRLVIDLTDLTFIDIRGLHNVVELTQETRGRGIPVEIRHHSRAVERLAHLLQVDEEVLLSDEP